MSRVALLGRPVAESLSPRMQNAAFRAAGLDWSYEAEDVAPEDARAAAHLLSSYLEWSSAGRE
ncbi:MAG: hypothetical protein ACXVRE_01985 [Gaiellaceae bacterium]